MKKLGIKLAKVLDVIYSDCFAVVKDAEVIETVNAKDTPTVENLEAMRRVWQIAEDGAVVVRMYAEENVLVLVIE